MIIKRDKDWIPICFLNPEFKNKKSIDLDSSRYKTMRTTISNYDHFNWVDTCLTPDIDGYNRFNVCVNRSVGYKISYGIMLKQSYNNEPIIIPCISAKSRKKVFKSTPYSDLTVFVDSNRARNCPSSNKRAIKKLISLGVNKKNIKYMDESDLMLKFCCIYSPTMLDYNEDKQKLISSSFIRKMRAQVALAKDVEESISDEELVSLDGFVNSFYTNFHESDLIVIVNNNNGGVLEIGSVCRIISMDYVHSIKVGRIGRSSNYCYYAGDGDIRHVSQDEINLFNARREMDTTDINEETVEPEEVVQEEDILLY